MAADLNTFGSRLWTEAVLDLLLNGNDTILGGQGSDHLRGMSGDDDISGNAGDDYINPGAGSDTIDGGEGFNGIDYGEYQSTDAAQLTGISINLSSDSFVDP